MYFTEYKCVLYLTVCVWQADNSVCVVFPDHSPEVCHGAAQRSLAHDELLTVVMSLWKQQQYLTTSVNYQFC